MGDKIALQNDLNLSVRLPSSEGNFYPFSGNGTKDNISNVDMLEVSYDQIATARRQRAVGRQG